MDLGTSILEGKAGIEYGLGIQSIPYMGAQFPGINRGGALSFVVGEGQKFRTASDRNLALAVVDLAGRHTEAVKNLDSRAHHVRSGLQALEP